MSQLYARVFVQILDSSIAEDFTLRHVFEDFFKLCDYRNGIIDMTRHALSRRLNIPLKLLNECIEKLESPDPSSRDSDFEGRRIERLDEHRDWGWKILNWEKYDRIRARASGAERAARHRDNVADLPVVEGAEEIYEAYPKRVAKLKALASISKSINEFGFEFLLSRTKAYAAARAGQDPQFTPMPATWFNQQRFNDDPEAWKALPQKPPDQIDRNANTINKLVAGQYNNVGKAYPTDANGNPL